MFSTIWGICFSLEAKPNAMKTFDSCTVRAQPGQNVGTGAVFGSPIITKDGVSLAKEIELRDPLENMGAQMVREVASKPRM